MNKNQDIIVSDNLELKKLIGYHTGLDVKTSAFYLKTGKGYQCCLQVYAYPDELFTSWFQTFAHRDTILAIDIIPTELNDVKSSIQKSIYEQRDRAMKSNDLFEAEEANHEHSKLWGLTRRLTRKEDQILKVAPRIFVHAPTVAELDTKVAEIIRSAKANEFELAVMPNEQLYDEYMKQSSLNISYPSGRKGKELTSGNLALSYPNQSYNLQDPHGIYLGSNDKGGEVVYDFWHNDGENRVSYFMIIVGLMRKGKSSTLKKLLNAMIMNNDRVRVSDLTGEFRPFCEVLNGVYVDLDGKSFALNPCGIRILSYKEKYTKQDLELILEATIKHLLGTLQLLFPHFNHMHLEYIRSAAEQLYVARGALKGIVPIEKEILYTDICKLFENTLSTPEQLELLEEEQIKDFKYIVQFMKRFEKGAYHLYFNQLSTGVRFEERLVIYNFRHLSGQGEMLKAMEYNLFRNFWNELVYYGDPQRLAWEAGELKEEDIQHYCVICDESHETVNADEEIIVDIIDDYVRESPKYFGGLILASHLISDYFPEYAESRALQKLKSLFRLAQYKLIFAQDDTAIPVLDDMFQGKLRQHYLDKIPKLKRGQAIMMIQGGETMQVNIHLSNFEKQYLSGGK